MLSLIEEPFEVCAYSGDPGCLEVHACDYFTRTLLICPACHAHDASGELIHEPDCILEVLRGEIAETLALLQRGDIMAAQARLERLLGRPCETAPGSPGRP